MQQEHSAVTHFGSGGFNSSKLQRAGPFSVLSCCCFHGQQPKLGDDEWFRRFRVFVKVFNAFVESSLNELGFERATARTIRI
jgi:hypothetical protein